MRKIYNYIFLLSVFPFLSRSQTARELTALMQELQARHNVVFSYDVELVKDVLVSTDSSQTDLRRIIQQLNTSTAFRFEFISNNNILVKPRYAGQNFIIHGAVFDSKTREPLLGTIVYQSKAKYGVYAGEDGSFHKAVKFNASDSIIISCIGYEKITVPLSYFASGSRTILLESQRIQISEVSVMAYLTSGVSYEADDNSINIRPRNLSILPGSVNGDILSSLDALPGISSPDGKAGNLNIRGATPDQTLINIDEIPIYLKGHYFGTISPINPNAVDEIKVQRSVMSVNKGGRAGGLIDIRTPGAVTNKWQGIVSASAIDGNAYVHAPVVKDRLSVAVSARRSLPYNTDNPALQPISTFVYQNSELKPLVEGTGSESLTALSFDYTDATAKINYNLSSRHKGSFSGLLIENNMQVDKEAARTNLFQSDVINLHNWGLNSSLYSAWTRRFNTFLSLTHSFYEQTFSTTKHNRRQDTLTSYSFFLNDAADSRLLFETDVKLGSHFSFKNGYDGRYQDFVYNRRTTSSTNTSFRQNFINKGTVHSLFSTLSGVILEKLSFNAGLRLNYYTVTEQFNLEPRFFANYRLNDAFRLKMSGGYQSQFVTQISGVSIESIGGLENQLWLLADGVHVPVIHSLQGSFGGIFEKNSWLVDLEGYYRDIQNIGSISLTAPLAENPYIHGNVATLGADVLVRKQWKSFDAWCSYSYSDSKMRFDSINNGEVFNSIYHQTHIIDVAGSYRLKQWKFSLAWKYRTGLDALPSIRTRMLHGADSSPEKTNQQQQPPPPPGGGSPPPPPGSTSGGPSQTDRYLGRFPDYHQLDASVYYMFPKEVKGYKGSVGVTVLNCYKQTNIIEQIPSRNDVMDRIMPNLSPNVFITLSF